MLLRTHTTWFKKPRYFFHAFHQTHNARTHNISFLFRAPNWETMKSEKLGFFVVLLLLSSSTCLAWFGSSKHKTSTANQQSSSSSSSSSPSYLNRFRSGSSVVFPVHGNVYPVGYVKGTFFSSYILCFAFLLQFHFMPFFLRCCFCRGFSYEAPLRVLFSCFIPQKD